MKTTTKITLGLTAVATLLVAGCDTLELGSSRTEHQASSLYSYLFPDQKNHKEEPAIPVLSLPLRVGVAFVPTSENRQRRFLGYTVDDVTISESRKIALMKSISNQFKQYPFVKSIDLIPTAYLTPGGSFANLDQLRSMYGVDVMVLLSYDQVQFTGENNYSVAYWTVVGAYVVPGEKNETRTMVDAAVFDIDSRKMLFRAPGIADIRHSTVPMLVDVQLHQDSEDGFTTAAANLTTNLQSALGEFKERVNASLAQAKTMGTNAPPPEFQVAYKPGYSKGSAAFGGMETILLGALGVCFLWTLRNQRKGKA